VLTVKICPSLADMRHVGAMQDIEGNEWDTFEDLFAVPTMPFTEILVELHVPQLPERWGTGLHDRLRHARAAPGACHVPNEVPTKARSNDVTSRTSHRSFYLSAGGGGGV